MFGRSRSQEAGQPDYASTPDLRSPEEMEKDWSIVDVSVYGGANDIPSEIWPTEEELTPRTAVRVLDAILGDLREEDQGIPGLAGLDDDDNSTVL